MNRSRHKTRKHRTLSPHIFSTERWVVYGREKVNDEVKEFLPRAFLSKRGMERHVNSVRCNLDCHIEKVVHERQNADGTWEVVDA